MTLPIVGSSDYSLMAVIGQTLPPLLVFLCDAMNHVLAMVGSSLQESADPHDPVEVEGNNHVTA